MERLRARALAPPSNNLQTTDDHNEGVERENPTFEELARSVRLSPSRLRHRFKADTGMTMRQYVRSLKIERAKELAGSTYLKIREIVEEVGGGEQSSFLRAFKRAEGVTLSEYRQLCYERSEENPREGH
jgi:two-component system response regulator YesN